ncbi:MAG TPA: polyribonucleotide nucleotidyltransferase [Nitrospinota bacterium]|nr:polyribonucleotide nucleotidyltransferase [Nitrospinota bacterium]
MAYKVKKDIRGKALSIETGELAKQADGSVLVTYGDTVVLVTAVVSKEVKNEYDFLPLTVDYRQKAYAAGKFPGGFFKREGRPGEKEILTSRLMDRPLRPLFPKYFNNEIQIIGIVLSVDQENDPDILSIIGASASLSMSKIPFQGPIGAVRIGLIDNNFIINPTYKELDRSDINLVVAGAKEGILMVEGGGKQISENVFLDAIFFGHDVIKDIVELQIEMVEKVGVEKMKIEEPQIDLELSKKIEENIIDKLRESLIQTSKMARNKKREEMLNHLMDSFGDDDEEKERDIKNIFEELEKREIRNLIISKKIRPDGRKTKDIRPVSAKIGILPRTHGSALFTRGETQALVSATLGTSMDEQRLDDFEGKSSKAFMLHYNFPPFSVGETRFLSGPGRREIGHGALAERALSAVLPKNEAFPYTIRLVSDILESNGSSSMATVCGGSLALMDAGAPISSAVGGIAMGLIKNDEETVILSDILGIEDHVGDMDFKVAGTEKGVTAIQMDIKIKGVDKEIMKLALEQAREGRLNILEKMKEVISSPRSQISSYAPKIMNIKINSEKIGLLIGPGGKTIRNIIDKTGANLEVDDSGEISIISSDKESMEKAIKMIEEITREAEIGKIYLGTVKKIMDFGAIVEIFPGSDGLVHISQISDHHVKNVSDELREGEEILVKVLDIDKQGRIRLSRKEALGEKKISDSKKN